MPTDTKGLDEALAKCVEEISRLRQECIKRIEENKLHDREYFNDFLPYHPECNNNCENCEIKKQLDVAKKELKEIAEKLEILRAEGFRVTTGV